MHETFLVIKTGPNDMGSRPLTGPFASPDLTVGPDGKPRAVVWNLGTREVRGVVTEFAYIPAGMPVRPEHKRIIGMGNPANIMANNSVQVTCNSIWPRSSHADVLIVTASHPELDGVKTPCDPLQDRRVGQLGYAWSGAFEGVCSGPGGGKVAVQIRHANKGLYRVKVFVAVGGRLPSNPQIDRTMAPTGHAFRWMETYSNRKEIWECSMPDNERLFIQCNGRALEEVGKGDLFLSGTIQRR